MSFRMHFSYWFSFSLQLLNVSNDVLFKYVENMISFVCDKKSQFRNI